MKALVFMERDLRKFFRNPLFVLTSILMPLLYLVILGNSLQGELKHLPLAVIDQDNGPYSQKFKKILQEIESGPQRINLSYLTDRAAGIKLLQKGIYKALILIPPDFSKDIIRKAPSEIGLIVDNTDSISAEELWQSIAEAVNRLNREDVFLKKLSWAPRLKYREYYPRVSYDQSLIPGVIVMAIFMGTMSAGVFNLIMDKFLGIHESYLVTPLSKGDIIFGFVLSGVFLSTLISVIVLILSTIITGVSISGGFKTFLAIILIIILSSLGLLSMMFVLLGRTEHPRIVGTVGGFLNVILFFPSGAIYPLESFPSWLRSFSRVNPHSYTVHALRSLIFKGFNLPAIKTDLIFLIIFTTLMSILATFSLKRTL